jgi:hypothetical protein
MRPRNKPHGSNAPQTSDDIRKYSFSVRVVKPLNQLPDSIKQAESKEAFKKALKQRKKQLKHTPVKRAD